MHSRERGLDARRAPKPGPAWLPRSRTPTRGPEHDLLERALAVHVWPDGAPRVVFREPELPTGYPDAVAVFIAEGRRAFPRERMGLREEHTRVLHHLHTVGSSTEEDISSLLRLTLAKCQAILADLARARLLQLTEHVVPEPLEATFVAERIVAIEAKVSDWRAALRQAVANTWFASHSCILLPAERFGPAVRDEARAQGIGVVTYDGSATAVAVRAREQEIPASHGSWLVNEWAVRHAGLAVSA